MKLQIFAVRDRATDQYGNPMFLVSAGQALRSFSDEVNRQDTNNSIYQHPDDYDLFSLGIYDTDTGLFQTNNPQQIGIGKDLKIRS